MEALTPTRLASLVDDNKLHAHLLKVAALAAPIAALHKILTENPPADYDEDTHEQRTYLKDMINLMRHLKSLGEGCLEFGTVLDSVEQRRRRVKRRKEFLRQQKSNTANRTPGDNRGRRGSTYYRSRSPFDSSDDEYVAANDPLQLCIAMAKNDRTPGSLDANSQISVLSDVKSLARSEDMNVISNGKIDARPDAKHGGPYFRCKGGESAETSTAGMSTGGMAPMSVISQGGLSTYGDASEVSVKHEYKEVPLVKRENEDVALVKWGDEENVPVKREYQDTMPAKRLRKM